MSPGEPPARGSSAPTTETLATVPRLPLSLRLIGRTSAPGAAIVAGLALVFVGLVPMLAEVMDAPASEGEDTVAASGTLELSLAEGWGVESQERGVTTLTNGSATLTVEASVSGPGSLDPLVDQAVDELAEDATANWVLGEPTPFETTSGHPGYTVIATSETLSTQTWVVDNGSLDTVSTLSAPLEAWTAALPGAEQIVDSMEVAPAAQPEASPGRTAGP